MMVLAADNLAELRFPLTAKIIGDGATSFAGVSTDTRKLHKGDLFVALRGDKYDGHVFAEQAVSGGAAALVVSEELPLDVPQLLVDNTAAALGRLGSLSRLNWRGELVAITGSNGKTTLKEMIGTVMHNCASDGDTLMTEANHNNTLGVPLTLLRLTEAHKYAIIEMGTDHPGEIGYSAALAKPSVVILNNIATAHLAGFGSRENIAREKGSLLEHLVADGLAILNGDDDFCPLWEDLAKSNGVARILKFGYGKTCDLRIDNARHTENGLAFDIILSSKVSDVLGRLTNDKHLREVTVELPVAGMHNAMNATAAFAACLSMGSPSSSILDALGKFYNVAGRLHQISLANNCLLLDDSYNANPASMAAAIDTLNARAFGRKRIAIIGDMYELGDAAKEGHREIGGLAGDLHLDGLIACGSMAEEVIDAYRQAAGSDCEKGMDFLRAFADTTSGNEYLGEYLDEHIKASGIRDAAFLVKGSRGMAMEKSVDLLMNKLGTHS